MSITLSNVTLRGGLVWTDRWSPANVAQKTVRTLGGFPVFYTASLLKGTPLTLASIDDQGWQMLAVVEQLYQLASVAGAQYLLDLGTIQHSVMFRHDEPPAFDATPLIPRTLAEAGDYFTVTLKLITV